MYQSITVSRPAWELYGYSQRAAKYNDLQGGNNGLDTITCYARFAVTIMHAKSPILIDLSGEVENVSSISTICRGVQLE